LLGGFIGYSLTLLSYNENSITINWILCTFFAGRIWFMPYISTRGVSPIFLSFGSSLIKSFDQGWCEFFGGQGLFRFFRLNSVIIQFLQLNLIKIYLMSFLIFLLIIAVLLYLNSLSLKHYIEAVIIVFLLSNIYEKYFFYFYIENVMF
jgi:NADH-ubiquinone oxidoreductase chain 5